MSVLTVGLDIVDILGRHADEAPEGQDVAPIDEIRMTVAGTAATPALNLAKLEVNVLRCGRRRIGRLTAVEVDRCRNRRPNLEGNIHEIHAAPLIDQQPTPNTIALITADFSNKTKARIKQLDNTVIHAGWGDTGEPRDEADFVE